MRGVVSAGWSDRAHGHAHKHRGVNKKTVTNGPRVTLEEKQCWRPFSKPAISGALNDTKQGNDFRK